MMHHYLKEPDRSCDRNLCSIQKISLNSLIECYLLLFRWNYCRVKIEIDVKYSKIVNFLSFSLNCDYLTSCININESDLGLIHTIIPLCIWFHIKQCISLLFQFIVYISEHFCIWICENISIWFQKSESFISG